MNIGDMRSKAANGNVAAQSILGICYLDGIEVEVDHHEAFRFLSAAAALGVPRAVANLARIYSEGLGIAKNIPEAILLYEQAAKAGEFDAQIALGRIYSRGTEVLANPDEALAWYSLALAQVDSLSECQEILEASDYVKAAGGPGLTDPK